MMIYVCNAIDHSELYSTINECAITICSFNLPFLNCNPNCRKTKFWLALTLICLCALPHQANRSIVRRKIAILMWTFWLKLYSLLQCFVDTIMLLYKII